MNIESDMFMRAINRFFEIISTPPKVYLVLQEE